MEDSHQCLPREAPLEKGNLDPLLPEPEPEWPPLKPPLEGGLGGLGGLFVSLDFFGGAPLRILKSKDCVLVFIDTADCAMKEFCCCSEFSLYISLTLPPKRG